MELTKYIWISCSDSYVGQYLHFPFQNHLHEDHRVVIELHFQTLLHWVQDQRIVMPCLAIAK